MVRLNAATPCGNTKKKGGSGGSKPWVISLNMPLPRQVPGVLSHAWPQHGGSTGVPPPQTPQLQTGETQADSDYTQGEQGQPGLPQGSSPGASA